jgi:hypothetical protein
MCSGLLVVPFLLNAVSAPIWTSRGLNADSADAGCSDPSSEGGAADTTHRCRRREPPTFGPAEQRERKMDRSISRGFASLFCFLVPNFEGSQTGRADDLIYRQDHSPAGSFYLESPVARQMSQTVIKIISRLEPLVRSRRHHAQWRLLVDTEATCSEAYRSTTKSGCAVQAQWRNVGRTERMQVRSEPLELSCADHSGR